MPDCSERPIGKHDWHSREYVENWIGRDVTHDDERRPLLQQMLRLDRLHLRPRSTYWM